MSDQSRRPGKTLGRIETDQPCDKCGYNLYSQAIWMDEDLSIPILRCPECGAFQAAGRATSIGNKWFTRLGAVLIGSWVIGLLGLVAAQLFLMGGLQVALADALTTWGDTSSVIIGRDLLKENIVEIVMVFGAVILSGLVLGVFVAVFVWPAKRHGLYWLSLVAPWIPAILLLALIAAKTAHDPARRADPQIIIVILAAILQTFAMAIGFFIGRPFTRWLLWAMVSPTLVQYLACLWTIDGRNPPPPPKGLPTGKELRETSAVPAQQIAG